MAQIEAIEKNGTTTTYTLSCPITSEFKVDQSVCHEGVCLTVTAIDGSKYQVDAIEETLSKTSLGKWKTGQFINLERSMTYQGRLDGHIVQGHVDETIECVGRRDRDGSWDFYFSLTPENRGLIIPRGSVTLNGVSLTVAEVEEDSFKVSIIPYTFEHTTFKFLKEGDTVNVEYDILGKYVLRYMRLTQSEQ